MRTLVYTYGPCAVCVNVYGKTRPHRDLRGRAQVVRGRASAKITVEKVFRSHQRGRAYSQSAAALSQISLGRGLDRLLRRGTEVYPDAGVRYRQSQCLCRYASDDASHRRASAA